MKFATYIKPLIIVTSTSRREAFCNPPIVFKLRQIFLFLLRLSFLQTVVTYCYCFFPAFSVLGDWGGVVGCSCSWRYLGNLATRCTFYVTCLSLLEYETGVSSTAPRRGSKKPTRWTMAFFFEVSETRLSASLRRCTLFSQFPLLAGCQLHVTSQQL